MKVEKSKMSASKKKIKAAKTVKQQKKQNKSSSNRCLSKTNATTLSESSKVGNSKAKVTLSSTTPTDSLVSWSKDSLLDIDCLSDKSKCRKKEQYSEATQKQADLIKLLIEEQIKLNKMKKSTDSKQFKSTSDFRIFMEHIDEEKRRKKEERQLQKLNKTRKLQEKNLGENKRTPKHQI